MGRDYLAPIATRLEIPYLDLTGALRDEVAATGKAHRFPNDNHFSDVGHDAAGKALAAWAEELLASPAPEVPGPH
jgi:lysophospholipase L1-like esterase